MHSDEDRWDVIKQGLKTTLQEFRPHREGAAVPGSHHREQSVTTALTARHSSQKGGVTDDQ